MSSTHEIERRTGDVQMSSGTKLDVVTSSKRSSGPRWFSVRRISAAYVLIALIVIFSAWSPDVFPHVATIQQVLNFNAAIGLVSLGLCVPLACGVFDLSFAFTMSLSGVTAAKLLVSGAPLWLSLLLAMGVAGLVGAVNAFVILTLKVESLIATLGTGSLIQALITYVTHDNPVVGNELSGTYMKIGQGRLLGVTLPVIYGVIAAFVLWYVFDHTPLGRRVYATGFNHEAAKRAGLRVTRLRFGALMTCALCAGWGGIVLSSMFNSGTPTAGTPYLLPAFAAVFLGATQIKPGRFNAWGTLLAVITLGTGITGLTLSGAPTWSANAFTGVVLITALALTSLKKSSARRA